MPFFTRVLLIWVLGQLLSIQCLNAQDELQTQFAAFVNQANAQQFSGIVVAERKGKIVATHSFGFADAESKEAIDTNTLFEIGSVTKPMTAFAVVALARKGVLSLDDSISAYLPNVPENCREITIRHLLQHTSGIPGTNYGPNSSDIAEVTKSYLRGGPQHKPGTRFEYWNQGYALLAAIISKETGQTYQEAMRELVFRPNQMNNSCFTGDKRPQGLQVSIGKSTSGAQRSALDHPYGNFYGLHYQGMGGVVSNVNDILEFVKAVRSSDSKELLQPGPDSNYGLGWRIEKVNENDRRVFHSGVVRGFLTSVYWYPEQESSFIVLANTDSKAEFSHVESCCRRAFEATIMPLPSNQEFDLEFRKSVVGQFVLQTRTITISEAGEGLEMVVDWGGPKTHATLAKTSSPTKLLILDGSGQDLFLSLGSKNENGQFESLDLLQRVYSRRK